MMILKNFPNNSVRYGCSFGKPVVPFLPANDTVGILYLVDVESWQLIKIIGLKADFMSKAVSAWCSCGDYCDYWLENLCGTGRLVITIYDWL